MSPEHLSSRLVDAPDGLQLMTFDFGGDGPPLLLLHATGFHAHVFLPMIRQLRASFHCYGFDLPAHGASPPPLDGQFGWRRFAPAALAVSDALGLDGALALGHSCGGAVLVMAEQERAGAWSGLYLYEPVLMAPVTIPLELQGERNPLAAGARRRRPDFPDRQTAYENYAAKPPLDALDPDALRAYVDYGLVDRPEGGVTLACRPENEAAYYQMAPLSGAWDRLGEVGCPTTVAGGDEQAHFGPEATAAVARLLPRGRHEVLHGLGHFGPLQAPDRVARSATAALLG